MGKNAGYFAHRFADRLHVSATTKDVLRYVRSRLAPIGKSRAQRKERHKLMRAVLKAHQENRDLVKRFRL